MRMPTVGDPVIEYQLPDHIYRAHPGISQSSMKELLVSPAHFMARYGPGAPPFFPSAAMIQGTAIHCHALEPETFDDQFINKAAKPKELTISDLKEQLDAQGIEYAKGAKKADLEGLLWPDGKPKDRRTTLDAETFEAVLSASNALATHDIAGQWFNPGAKDFRKWNEVSLFAVNQLGQMIKGRFDRLQYDGVTLKILDLKTTHTASPKEFQRTCANFSYDLQAAWYSDLAKCCFPEARAVEFYFVALERKAPHGLSVFKASQALLANGRQKMAKALDLYAQCTELDYWPSYDPIVHELDMPSWARHEDKVLEAAF